MYEDSYRPGYNVRVAYVTRDAEGGQRATYRPAQKGGAARPSQNKAAEARKEAAEARKKGKEAVDIADLLDEEDQQAIEAYLDMDVASSFRQQTGGE